MTKEKLGYYWVAEMDSGLIYQFVDDEETPFSVIEADMNNLKKFSIMSADDTELYEVDFEALEMKAPNNLEYTLTGSNPVLIYKRRNKVRAEMGSGKILDSNVTHILGIKTDTEEKYFEVSSAQGQRQKKVKIKEDGVETDLTESV
ncbi:hypothetical protein [Oceanihabitans sediminis]|uniref:hypothetical protein n=1 Tax=Oceanihabitans sediminis TaxID=1812012 RepID=UPI00299CD6DD|nr:hypothetical protein [Oceanihabitans sediminis]MDX1278550.1 hypothetical protein [Oceanihabitans sediminis]